MNYEKISTISQRTEVHAVTVQVTDVDDVPKNWAATIMYAPEKVILRWTRHGDEEWDSPRVMVEGRRRRKDGSLGATVRDSYPRSPIANAWIGEIAAEVGPR